MIEPGWDDERLATAFHKRFDGPAPGRLEKDVHARIVGTSPARFGVVLRGARAWSLVAAVLIVVLAGTLVVGVGGLGRGLGSPEPSDANSHASAGPNATPTEQALPGLVFDLPLIRVTDAIAVRDAGVDDREVAVLGWFSDGGIPACPAPVTDPVSPLQVGCPDGFVWLMERAESLIHQSGNQTTGGAPTGPAINPDLDGVDRSWEPADAGLDANGDSTPVDVVFVGHFDDRRAVLCPEPDVAACRDRFVVDSVARVRGVEPPRSVTGATPGTTKSNVADIEAIIANEAPQSTILSMIAVDAPTDLATIEPSLKTTGDGLLVQSIVWVVRALEADRISTYLIVDGMDRIYEMNPDNRAVQLGGAPAGPAATDGRGYTLDCGPLSPVRCQHEAAAVVAANPSKHLVSLTFFDECGSYNAIFDDGTGVGAQVDCFLPPEPS